MREASVFCVVQVSTRKPQPKSKVECAGPSVFCAVPEQSRSLRHPHSRAGGELDIGSHAGARPEPKCAFVSHVALDVMKRLAHTRGVCIERALSRT